MSAASSDFSKDPKGGAKLPVISPASMTVAQDGNSADFAIGQEVARMVEAKKRRPARSAAPSTLEAASSGLQLPTSTSPAITMTVPQTPQEEPEEVGERGSRLRRCIVTGDILPHDQMIRFVAGPDDVLTPDLAASLPGRGYWVTARLNVLQRAVNGDAFTKAARRPVVVPPALIDQVIVLARRACLSTLGLARRGWALDYGYDNVRQALVARKVGLILLARNAPADMLHKIEYVRGDTPINTLFTTAELSVALGRESLAFVAIHKGQWTQRLLTECTRLAQLLMP